MKSNKYLYDVEDLSHLLKLSYLEAIMIKINLSKQLLTKLTRDDDMEDDERIKEVKKAIEFNKKQMKLKD